MLQQISLITIYFFIPFFTYAAEESITITAIFNRLTQVLNLLIPFLVLLATVVFLFGVLNYITAGGDEKKLKEAKSVILWGIIALAIMLTAWGFVEIVIDFIFGNETLPPLPGPDLAPFL
ncbi:MAG: hypothetical protein A3J54_03425 [Candidatus Ryanbacteria bacterium RIFCSPHIGHO2_02_FULL_45_13b]|uniref:Uncharacterized protein n=1 Tax=Candidatus Ryanbacteria bacterium RIFCSPHIGHO2_02_FULL_45_13b TaxID=1802117 RepID=A0A1G2GAU8_9BACT|nr:MAG: hypothetical protein A3J54_03425 [Candidatus Ryanbacteria bacterium RIFCSPHIGHO2_02_FULL_45_13b]